jgi:hypothetical protein
MESAGQFAKKTASSAGSGVRSKLGDSHAAVSQPVQAGGCVLVSAKARGLGEAAASKRSQAKLVHNISHWAHKNKLATVHTGHAPTDCSKGKAGALFLCTSSAKVCP